MRQRESVKIGDRVCWSTNHELIGTIKDIVLTEFPFYVVWDNGKDDWYKGSNLEKYNEPRID